MFHKKIAESVADGAFGEKANAAGLRLVPRGAAAGQQRAWPELASIGARRCSAFFAEAAVLVLVFGVLDFFMQRGHIEGGWVAGAITISVALLLASVGTEFSARRWLGAHP